MKGLIVLLGLSVILLSGCFSIRYEPIKSSKPVLAGTSIERPYKITDHFKDKEHYFYFLFGLFPITQHNALDLVEPHLNSGDGIMNLKTVEKFGFWNTVGNLLTAGLVTSRSVKVEGDVFIYEP